MYSIFDEKNRTVFILVVVFKRFHIIVSLGREILLVVLDPERIAMRILMVLLPMTMLLLFLFFLCFVCVFVWLRRL